MAKATDNTPVVPVTAHTQVTVPKSAALYRLLQGTGKVTGPGAEKVLNGIAVHADPRNGAVPVVTLLATPTRPGYPSEADTARQGLAVLLRKARAEGHETAGLLAGLAGQLGYREPAPESAPAPAPTLA